MPHNSTKSYDYTKELLTYNKIYTSDLSEPCHKRIMQVYYRKVRRLDGYITVLGKHLMFPVDHINGRS